MSLKYRRIIYILFILSFLIITPLLCLYATGYKLGDGFKVQKTGMLIIDSKPQGAKIYLDGKAQQNFLKKILSAEKSYITTPAKLKNISPGEYEVKIELPNYLPWQKKLTVKSRESTFAENINLFKENLPLILLNGFFDNLSLSRDKKRLLAVGRDNAALLNLESEEIKIFLAASSSQADFTDAAPLWSPKKDKIILGKKIFFENDWERPLSLNKIIETDGKNIKWSKNNNKIYYLNKKGIYSYNLSSKAGKNVFKNQSIIDYMPKDDYIYFISKESNATYLNVQNLEEKKPARTIKLPNADYKFLNPNHKLINLYNQTRQTLYLFDPFSSVKPLRETINNITKSRWINDNKLLYGNDFEIWIFNLDNARKTLLTRISRPIKQVIWHPSNNYIIYATNKDINILELDDREKYNITGLIKLDIIKGACLNEKGDTLYFYAEIGSQKGLYRLSI